MTTTTNPTPKITTNPNKLPWTQDRSGARQELRRGGARAVGRILGDKKRLEDYLADLEILAEYGRAKYEEQIAAQARRVANANKRVEAQEAVAREAAKRAVVDKRRALKRAEADLKSAEARVASKAPTKAAEKTA